jgi:hypothetical protein
VSSVSVGFYLIVGQYFRDSGFTDGKPSVRTAKTKPRCDPHEVAIWLQVDLPEALFKRPNLQARIRVPEAQAPFVITPEVQQNIAQVVQEQLGITMQISANTDTQPKGGQEGGA